MSVQVRNINPVGAVMTVIDGESREVARGEVITVAPETAGKAPAWRRVGDDEVTVLGAEYRDHAGHREIRDLGFGLLAQEINWEPVTPAPASSKSEKGDA